MMNLAFAVDDSALTLQGLTAGTDVLTAEGALAVEHVSAGDRIVTRSGLRSLRAVSVRIVRCAAMVCIGVDTLGVGRPDRETLVPAGQHLMIRDWRATAMFGKPHAMIPAVRLVDGRLIRAAAQTDVRLFSLYFDGPEVIYAGGLELGCFAQTIPA